MDFGILMFNAPLIYIIQVIAKPEDKLVFINLQTICTGFGTSS